MIMKNLMILLNQTQIMDSKLKKMARIVKIKEKIVLKIIREVKIKIKINMQKFKISQNDSKDNGYKNKKEKLKIRKVRNIKMMLKKKMKVPIIKNIKKERRRIK